MGRINHFNTSSWECAAEVFTSPNRASPIRTSIFPQLGFPAGFHRQVSQGTSPFPGEGVENRMGSENTHVSPEIPVELHVFHGHSNWWIRKQQQRKWKTRLIGPALSHQSFQRVPNEAEWQAMGTGESGLARAHFKSFQKADRPSHKHWAGLHTWVLRDFCFSKMIQGSSPQSKFGYTCFQGSVFIHNSNYCPSLCTAFIFCTIRKTTRCEWWGTDFP